jgi:signal transduction histidine kinase
MRQPFSYLLNRRSILSSLTWSLVLTVVVIMVIFNLVFYLIAANQAFEDLQNRVRENAQELAGVLEFPLWNFDEQTIQQIGQVYSTIDEVISLHITDDAGRAVYEYDVPITDPGVINETERITFRDQTIGQVAISFTTQGIQAALQRDLVATALSTLLVVIAIIIVSYILSRRLLQDPLNRLSEGINSISNGAYDDRLSTFGKTELDTIVGDVNDLAHQISEREAGLKKARDEAVVAQHMAQETSRLKSEFLSTMSHELRTPLNAIEGFTAVVLKKMGGAQFNDKTEEYLNRVHSNSRRLLQLINDFLDLSRVEAGRLELANQPFGPARLAQRWHDEVIVLADKKGLYFDLNLDSSLPDVIYGDEEAISKVAINLLSNAIKFTEQGGIKLSLDSQDSVWSIVVTDSGIGIPPHAREFIFEEFRQVDQSSKRKHGGTGLGLAIVQKYVRSMGGSVSVRSEIGQGSTFTVTLPLKTSA